MLLLVTALSASLYGQGRCQKGDCYTGAGVYRYTDGTLYSGNFEAGRFEGLGTLTYPDGAIYTGTFHDQRQTGKGKLTDTHGNDYTGEWQQGKRHGTGRVTYADGSTVEGQWYEDRPQGPVTYRQANRDTYVGNWANDAPDGEGAMTYPNGTTVRGNWHQGELSVQWSALGYTGEDSDLTDCGTGNCRSGLGVYTYADGTRYRGEVSRGVPRGRGSVTFTDGNVYHGSFLDHRPEGLGIMHYADGRLRGGVWSNGQLYRELHADVATVAQEAAPEYDEEVKVWAVVVGCATYQHMKALRYTDDDAYQFYAFLKSIEGGALQDGQINLLIDEEATHDNILAALRQTFRKADENDQILFYFSGHGLPGAFLPVDAQGEINALRHDEVNEVLSASKSRHKLVIADACHSGSLAARSGRSNTASLSAYYTGLGDATASTALLMSSAEEEISMEDRGLRSGVFSHYLIRGLKGEADLDRDYLVTIQELFDYVHREVRGYTGSVQTPTLTGSYDARMPMAALRAR